MGKTGLVTALAAAALLASCASAPLAAPAPVAVEQPKPQPPLALFVVKQCDKYLGAIIVLKDGHIIDVPDSVSEKELAPIVAALPDDQSRELVTPCPGGPSIET